MIISSNHVQQCISFRRVIPIQNLIYLPSMKLLYVILFLLSANLVYSQSYKIEINSGNHEDIISSYYDREKNELIALDKMGFVVCWDLGNFSVINKFQLPPEYLFGNTKREMLGRYDLKAYDSVIVITYPESYNHNTNGQRIVDVYHRRTGAFIQQTDFGKISCVAYMKDGTMLNATSTTTKSGYIQIFKESVLTKTSVKNTSTSIALSEAATCISIDEKKKRIAIGYRNGTVEIRDLATLQILQTFTDLNNEREKSINQLLFIPASDKIAFNAERSGKIIIRDAKTGTFTDSMNLDETDYRIAVSASGKYLTAIRDGFYYLYWHDLQKKVTELKHISAGNAPALFLHDVFFLTDEMMIGVGRNGLNSQSVKVNGIGNAGAWLGLIDPKVNMGSSNLNITTASSWMQQYGVHMLKHSALGSMMHGVLTDDYVYTDPSKLLLKTGKLTDLKEQFNEFLNKQYPYEVYVKPLEKAGSVSAPDLTEPFVMATVYNERPAYSKAKSDTFMIAYYNVAADTFVRKTQLLLPEAEAHYYSLLGGLHTPGTAFFKHTFRNAAGHGQTELLVFDERGKKLLTDTLVENYNNKTICVSPNKEFIVYQTAPGKLVVRSLKYLTLVNTIYTGFGWYGYDPNGYANPEFLSSKPATLLHEAYQVVNNNQGLCLLATDLKTNKADTIISIALRPINYSVDSNAAHTTLIYNFDLNNPVLANNDSLQKSVLQGFKNIFQPTAVIYNTKTKDIDHLFHTGNSGTSSATLNGNWLTVLQNDGQLVYFDTQKPNNRIAHVIDGNAQALVADSFYYASHGLLPLIKFSTAEGSFTAEQADIFLNRPQDILQQFIPQEESVIKPYRLAYNKRLSQQQLQTNLSTLLKADKDIRMKGTVQSFIYTDKKQIDLSFTISDKTNISKIKVMINGQPVFGKRGVNVKKALAENKLSLDLGQGENYISITAETIQGKQLDPVKYYYYYTPKMYKRGKLYLFSAGVSNYKDTTYNLKYAAKDAGDILQAFKYKVADTIISQVLTDKEVTVANINAWAKQIEQADVDDVVILYFAGHGLLDVKNNFYYGVHNMDFQQPGKNGLSYEAILDLLDKSPSRKKILLLDACHSGAFDRSLAKQTVTTTAGETTKVVSNEKRGLNIKMKPVFSEQQAFVLMNQVFNDLSSDIGIDVIAASLGNSYALEKSSLQNGLFTYAMIRAVGLSMAAGKENETETITMEQVKRFIEKEVKQLSNGEQVPSIRSNNVQSGAIQFYYSWNNADEVFKEFIEKYR
jgi:hypothetical protein